MSEPFKHYLSSDNVDQITGFSQCLSAVFNYLQEKTEMKPEKRFIDGVELAKKIGATAKTIADLLGEAQKKLKELQSKIVNQ